MPPSAKPTPVVSPPAAAAPDLRLEHVEPMRRLLRVLQTATGPKGSRLLFLQSNDAAQRVRLMQHLQATQNLAETLELDRHTPPDFITLRTELERRARANRPIQIVGLEPWLEGPAGRELAHTFNLHREALAELCPVPLLFWLSERAIKIFATEAPDFWAWRAAVLDFDAKTEPELLLRLYCRQIVHETSALQLSGIDRKLVADEQDARIELAAVYTDLETLSFEKSADEELSSPRHRPGLRPGREPKRLSALAFVDANPCAVLLGDPGSGKSTFANFLALALAGEALRLDTANLARLGSDWRAGPLLPVRVVLREWAARLPIDRPATAAHLWDYIAWRLGDSLRDFLPLLRHRLETQGGLLLLDGLDEVPEARRSRLQIKDAVLDFHRQFPRTHILLTCRTYAYQRQEWRLPGFTEAVLAPFNSGQIENFVDRWYRHLAQVRGGRLLADAAGRATLLKRAIARDPHLEELARRPLLLTLMASLHAWRGGNLPEQREELYEQAVDLLLDVWERPKTVLDEHGQPLLQQESAAEWFNTPRKRLMEALEALAFHAHQAQREGAAAADITEADFIQALLKAQINLHSDRVIEFIRDRAGLLLDRGGGLYSFPHRTFQEYMAARYLARTGFPRKLVGLLRDDVDRWREVFLLTGAVVARATPFAAWSLLRETCPRAGAPDQAQALTVRDWRCALLSGQLLVETGIASDRELEPDEQAGRQQVREALSQLVSGGHLPPVDRATAGAALGKLGDPRPGVGAKDGLPDLDWIAIPAGPFLMGSEKGGDAYDAETPQFQCKLITTPYRISRYPVTVAQYQAFVDAGGYDDQAQNWWTTDGWKWKQERKTAGPADYEPPFQNPNHPRVGVSWFEAVAFCRWLAEKTGQPIRLPSEAEWERAARHTDARKYPWGGEEECALRCNMAETGIGSTCAVGIFPNGNAECGAADMAGNVWEWCRTKWTNDYKGYAKIVDDNPEGGSARVLRGGAWSDVPRYLRGSYRSHYDPDLRGYNVGFRVVCAGACAR